ncbi:UNKNOWN [Stylonychia lemnae]|uniref:Transmembrane protein n=1 Tax=Stylonychia lemnae TaxID=5949 RepID=A0A078AUP7_STYLE|nr:UNKNOWN [Stylonychia lemnae]|eukprot:CDW85899.1 UNKNOWN [Stylonychia lemnae]
MYQSDYPSLQQPLNQPYSSEQHLLSPLENQPQNQSEYHQQQQVYQPTFLSNPYQQSGNQQQNRPSSNMILSTYSENYQLPYRVPSESYHCNIPPPGYITFDEHNDYKFKVKVLKFIALFLFLAMTVSLISLYSDEMYDEIEDFFD